MFSASKNNVLAPSFVKEPVPEIIPEAVIFVAPPKVNEYAFEVVFIVAVLVKVNVPASTFILEASVKVIGPV